MPKRKSNPKIHKKGNEKVLVRLWEGKDSAAQKHHTCQEYKDSTHRFSDTWGLSSDTARTPGASSVWLDFSWSLPATVSMPRCSPLLSTLQDLSWRPGETEACGWSCQWADSHSPWQGIASHRNCTRGSHSAHVPGFSPHGSSEIDQRQSGDKRGRTLLSARMTALVPAWQAKKLKPRGYNQNDWVLVLDFWVFFCFCFFKFP